ncbi:hypothetical protein ACJJIE_02830 [Microbulbifer sp. TRSA001]|uniref:hypothetical protein n=1 Tax=Microbulbifer sp. TRSA001 TaxID=3243381 RepID=UPI0040398259
MKKKNLFIHIGYFKTGTSTIQRFCSDNTSLLLDAGILYPSQFRPENNKTNHGLLSLSAMREKGLTLPLWFSRSQKNMRKSFSACLSEISKISDKHGDKNILISSEEFVHFSIDSSSERLIGEIANAAQNHNIVAICYLRNPLSYLASWYLQVSKEHPTPKFSIFAARQPEYQINHKKTIDLWSKSLGRENVHLFSYDKLKDKHLENFCNFLHIPHQGIDSPNATKIIENKSKPFGEAEVLRRIKCLNKITNPQLAYNTIHDSLRENSPEYNQLKTYLEVAIEDYSSLKPHLDSSVINNLKIDSIFEVEDKLNQPSSMQLPLSINPDNFIKCTEIADIYRELFYLTTGRDDLSAHKFIEEAHRLRPSGPLIKRLFDYSKLLNS